MSSVVLTIWGHLGNHPLLSLFVYYNFTLSWSILDVLRRFSNVDTLTETIHKSVLSYLRKQHLNRQCCNRMNHVTVPTYLMWKRNHQIIKWIQCTMGLNRFDLRVDMDSDPQHCSEHHISIVVTVRNLLPIGFWWQLQDPCTLQASPWTWILWQTNTGNIGNELSICQCMVVLGRRETFLIWATKGIYSTLIILTIDGEGLAPGLSIRLEAGIKVTWKNVICFRGHWNIFCCSV